jgi:hypothetical protein
MTTTTIAAAKQTMAAAKQLHTATYEALMGDLHQEVRAAENRGDHEAAFAFHQSAKAIERLAYGFTTYDHVRIGNGAKIWYVSRINTHGSQITFDVELRGWANYTGAARPIRYGLTADQLTAVAK